MRSLSSAAACLPISVQGCLTSVSLGSKQSAHSKSSKPTSERSRGIERPFSRMARTAPIVVMLLPVTNAVGGAGSDRIACVDAVALAVSTFSGET